MLVAWLASSRSLVLCKLIERGVNKLKPVTIAAYVPTRIISFNRYNLVESPSIDLQQNLHINLLGATKCLMTTCLKLLGVYFSAVCSKIIHVVFLRVCPFLTCAEPIT